MIKLDFMVMINTNIKLKVAKEEECLTSSENLKSLITNVKNYDFF